jgi:hypothetical protein
MNGLLEMLRDYELKIKKDVIKMIYDYLDSSRINSILEIKLLAMTTDLLF